MSETPEEKRRKRLQLLARKIRDDGSSSYRELVGWAVLRWGCKRETVREYLEDLRWAGVVSFTKEEVAWIGSEP